MSYVTHQIPITIRHQWQLNQSLISNVGRCRFSHPEMTLTPFLSDGLPGVSFKVLSGIISPRKLTVILSKKPHYSAKAAIKIFQNGEEKAAASFDKWIDPCVFNEIPDVAPTHSFECEITWHGFEEKLPTMNLYDNVKHLLNRRELSDFVIIVNDEQIPVHKIILASQSPFFSAMFTTDMLESANNQLIVKDIEADIMKSVIEFLYTGEIDPELDVDIVLLILSVADRYQIMGLKILCGEILAMKLTVTNVLKIVENASLYGVLELVDQAIEFMVNNRVIALLKDFEDFGMKNPKVLIKYNIRLSEIMHTVFHDGNPLKISVKSIDEKSVQ